MMMGSRKRLNIFGQRSQVMSKKKKILIITLAWAPVESGGEIAPRKIAEMLTRNPSEQKSP